MKRTILFSFILSVTLITGSVFAQNLKTDRRIRIAQEYERIGEYEKALNLYQDLFKAYPFQKVFLNGIKRNLEVLKRYDELTAIIERELLASPQDVNLLGKLSEIKFITGYHAEARAIWKRIIALNPRNVFYYIHVSNLQSSLRLIDEAIETLKLGRQNTSNGYQFSKDLARLYIYQRNYPAAANELLSLIKTNKSEFRFSEISILNFPEDKDIADSVSAVLKHYYENNRKSLEFVQILINYLIKNKRYENAFEYVLEHDKLSGNTGQRIINFAREAFNNGNYTAARNSFEYYIKTFHSGKGLNVACYYYAYTLEKLSEENSRKDAPGAVSETMLEQYGAIPAFKQVVTKFPRTEWAAQSYFRLGEIYFHKIFDIDKAINAYQQIGTIMPRTPVDINGRFRTAECLLVKGDLDGAKQIFTELSTPRQAWAKGIAERSRYKLARIAYFEGKFDKAKEKFDKLSSSGSPGRDIVNDALEQSVFLEEFVLNNKEVNTLYAKADMYIEMKKYGDAKNLLEMIIDRFSGNKLTIYAYYTLAGVFDSLKDYSSAKNNYKTVIEKYPESGLAQISYIDLGSLYSNDLNKIDKALALYEDFLIKYPGSIYLEEIRKKIRALRPENTPPVLN